MILNPYYVLFGCVTIILIVAVTLLIAQVYSLPRGSKVMLSIAVTALTVMALRLIPLVLHPEPCTVSISSPQTGHMVDGYQVTVSGNVAPKTARVTVVVRSESDLRWWVQEIVHTENIDNSLGEWSLTAFLGTLDEGLNKNFELIALASNDSVIFNLATGRFLRQGLTLPVVPLWSQSDLVIVRRVSKKNESF